MLAFRHTFAQKFSYFIFLFRKILVERLFFQIVQFAFYLNIGTLQLDQFLISGTSSAFTYTLDNELIVI
jgi:hypothetical protein